MQFVYRTKKTAICFSLALILLITLLAPTANAAIFELPVTIKTAFDKMTGAADQSTAAKLKTGYSSLQTVQRQDVDWDTKISTLSHSNEEKLLAVRQRIKVIDEAKLTRLEEEVKKTEAKYEKLFTLHKSLTEQYSLAKSVKSKTLTAVLQPQLDASKLGVQIAKEDIKRKKAALKDAKTSVTKKSKVIKTTLVEIDKIKIKIRAAKSSISSSKKLFTGETNTLKTAVRASDSTNTIKSLARLNGYMDQISAKKKEIYRYEEQITAVITKANAQF